MPNFGWCDDPKSELYNTFVELPISVSHENLWLDTSNVYDLLAVVDYNVDPVVPYKGSAIFFHVTESFGPTAGCVAVCLDDLKWVLQNMDEDTYMIIR